MSQESEEAVFLRKIQRLLDEGEFVATYKFALLQAIADLSVESNLSQDQGLRLSLPQIAEKFIDYYWWQVLPYNTDADGISGTLLQNTGQQAAVVNHLSKAHQHFDGKLANAKADASYWRSLIRSIAGIVERMPLWKLQTVAGVEHEFLYRRSDYQDRTIRLLPGVGDHLRSFHGLITRLIRSSWVDHVRSIGSNQVILGDSPNLDDFLFGNQRSRLASLKPILAEAQSFRCFYSGKLIRSGGEVDHFIPWSRYPTDLGHNFVLAEERCNRWKSDFLAHPYHLRRWVERNAEYGQELGELFAQAGFQQDLNRSFLVAKWAYQQGERSGSHVWLRDKEYMSLPLDWRDSFEA